MTQEEALADALGFLGCIEEPGDGPATIGDAAIEWCDDGHSGAGWYVWCDEYPEAPKVAGMAGKLIPQWFGFCLRCAGLVGKAAMGEGR